MRRRVLYQNSQCLAYVQHFLAYMVIISFGVVEKLVGIVVDVQTVPRFYRAAKPRTLHGKVTHA